MDDYLDYFNYRTEINEDDLTYINKKGQTVTLENTSKRCCQPVRRVCKETGKRKRKVKCTVIKGKKCCRGSKSNTCSCTKLKAYFKRMASITMKKLKKINSQNKMNKIVTKTGSLMNHHLRRKLDRNTKLNILRLIKQTRLQGRNSNPKCTSKYDLRYFFLYDI